MSQPDLLWLIRSLCELVQDEGAQALSEPIPVDGDTFDSPECTEAREMLQKATSAAELLRDHLEEAYEFAVTGQCESKEVTCD